MSVDTRGLLAFQKQLEALREDIPEIMNQLIIGEGVYAVKQARYICKQEKISRSEKESTGAYRNNFHAGDKALMFDGKDQYDGAKPKRSGTRYRIDFYNNLNYAKPLEHGFRGHFVPGKWEGKTFVYEKGAKEGMYVPFHRGHFTLKRAKRRTENTQEARLKRKINAILKERLGPDWRKYR